MNVQGPNATIGGTQGTSPVTCSGDCNLVSGNRGDGIELDTGNPAGALVVGNTIGADLIGEQPLGNNNGVIGGGMTVGGTVTAAGLAPGNLIAGNRTVEIGAWSPSTISGNLIGLDRSGTRALWPLAQHDGDPKHGQGGIVVDSGTLLVGGPAGQGNVIGGEPAGVAVGPGNPSNVTIEGNRIGTTADGSTPVLNHYGVVEEACAGMQVCDWSRYHVEVLRNQISGNETGVEGVDVAAGNLIGTNADGTASVPNGTGVFDADLVGGMRPAGSTACDDPCNVISGNTGPAVVSSRTEEIQILGNFIGTDPGGRIAVPNGTANGDAAVVASFAGGPSDAASGVCDLACNLISGNAGPGAALTNSAYNSEDLLQGNVIGETIDGLPLGNAGAGVEVGPANAGVLVGGDGNLGNVIAHNGGPGVSVPSLLVDNRPAIVGNSITGNGGGIVFGSMPPTRSRPCPCSPGSPRAGPGWSCRAT